MSYKLNKIKTTAQRLYLSSKGRFLSNRIDAYWWNEVKNFGDLLTPLLLKEYGLTPIHNNEQSSELLSTGSILQRAPDGFSGTILGSGLLEPKERRFPNATILSVRGPLTRDCIGAREDLPLGDPGLLVSRFFKRPELSFEVGLVPHYTDIGHPEILRMINFFGENALFIDVRRSPKHVIRDISKCSMIISSSLHGLIVSHSFSIPCVWLRLGNAQGSGFKYRDYFQSLEHYQPPIASNEYESLGSLVSMGSTPPSSIIEENITETEKLFLTFSDFVRGH